MPHTGEDELIRLLRGQDALVQEVYSILEEEEKKDDILRAVVLSSTKPCTNVLTGIDHRLVFTLDAIRTVCIKYRLRFLPAGRFKGHLPAEALQAIRRIEAGSGAPLGGFMVLASAKHFKLRDCEADPMLFVPMGGDEYYLVHRWGRDMRTTRAVFGWPMRSWGQLAAVVIVLAALVAALVPSAWLSTEPRPAWFSLNRFALFICVTLFLSAATSYAWLAFFGQFSKEAWNSSTFN